MSNSAGSTSYNYNDLQEFPIPDHTSTTNLGSGAANNKVADKLDLTNSPFNNTFFQKVTYITSHCTKLNDLAYFDEYWKDLQYYLQLFGDDTFIQAYYYAIPTRQINVETLKLVSAVLTRTINSKYIRFLEKHHGKIFGPILIMRDLKEKSKEESNKFKLGLNGLLGTIRLLSSKPEDKARFVEQFEEAYRKAVRYHIDDVITYDTILIRAYDNLAKDPNYTEQIQEYENSHLANILFDEGVGVTAAWGFTSVASLVEIIREDFKVNKTKKVFAPATNTQPIIGSTVTSNNLRNSRSNATLHSHKEQTKESDSELSASELQTASEPEE